MRGNPSGIGRATVCQAQIRKRYLEVMCQLINGSMAADEILKVWEEAYQTVKDVVPLEKDIAWGGRDPSSPAINKSFGAEYVRLKSWIPARIASVRSQISCAPGCTDGCDRGLHLPDLRRASGAARTTAGPPVSRRPSAELSAGPLRLRSMRAPPPTALRLRPAAPAAPAGLVGPVAGPARVAAPGRRLARRPVAVPVLGLAPGWRVAGVRGRLAAVEVLAALVVRPRLLPRAAAPRHPPITPPAAPGGGCRYGLGEGLGIRGVSSCCLPRLA